MRYSFDASFERSLKRVDPLLGLGLTKLRPHVWEVRSGLAQRILCWRTRNEVRFTFVGSHDEVRRFLKQLR